MLICVTGSRQPTTEAAEGYAAWTVNTARKDGKLSATLLFLPLKAFGAKERNIYTDRTKPCFDVRSTIALVTESAMVRGAITAMAWFYRSQQPLRAFRPEDYRDALKWLHASENIVESLALLRMLIARVDYDPNDFARYAWYRDLGPAR